METLLGKEIVDPEWEGILTKVPPTLCPCGKTPGNVLELQPLSGWGT